jgi:ribonuclease Z
MRPSFHPRLINGPFDDPGLFIPFQFQNRAVIFDLGDIQALSSRDILKITHGFVSHTHMDHFIGFDRILRLFLGREKKLSFFGPRGFLKNVEGKLAGYSWNLVEKSNNTFCLQLTEIRRDHMLMKVYCCRDKFAGSGQAVELPFTGIVHQEPAFKVSVVILDHGLPCLGFCMTERFHINIIKEAVEALGLDTGPWLNDLKQALYQQVEPETEFVLQDGKDAGTKSFALGELAEKITRISPGQKFCYITDAAFNPSNRDKIQAFIKDCDHLYIEAAFLEKDRHLAEAKKHLTALQAGHLAYLSRVKQLTVFHFSPRYMGMEELLRAEAMEGFAGKGLDVK